MFRHIYDGIEKVPIPPPPPPGANNGGYFVIAYTNGVRTHRMRFHVAPFVAATGVYLVAQGSENDVSTSEAAIIGNFRGLWTNSWTFSVAALYQYQAGLPVQIPITGSTASQVGASVGGAPPLVECFYSLNFRTSLLGRARVFLIEPAGWVASVANNRGVGDGLFGTVITYLTGANTGIVGHDGGKLKAPAHFTSGLNRKLRRRAGDA